MNQKLTNEIIRHIFNCLGIKLPDKKNKIYSVMQPEYLIDHKLTFDDGIKHNIWGLEFDISKAEDSLMQIAVEDLTQDNIPEYSLIVTAQDSPVYACYMTYDEYNTNPEEAVDRSMIACCLHDDSWAECNIYLQGAFLCAMEKVREVNSKFRKVTDSTIVKKISSFIEYYQSIMEREYAGQES